MDRRFLIVLILSAGLAACVAGVLYRVAATSRPAPIATRAVVVAAANLPLGNKIRRADLKLVFMPEAMLPRNSFSRVEDVQERSVIGAIFQDEPVLKDRIAAPGALSGLAPMIADGQRAVSIRVNDVIGVAGFVQPGMRVDVLVTGRPPGSNDSVTQTVLQNVVVLSAGQVLQAEPKGQAINAAVVTLQVSPQEAETLILASGEGHIQLVLRNPGDSRRQATSGTLLSAIYGTRTTPEPAPRRPRAAAVKSPSEPIAPASSPPPARTVEVVRGTRKSLDPVESQGAGSRFLN
ncbi:MAG: Flp pilus assembly protein CpaB [Acidobacteriota bacterium]|nr:Flp pilus assembly protein CpaB [Acidobacteriota bacterium]